MKLVLTPSQRGLIIQFLKFGTVGVFGFGLDNALVYFGIYELGLSHIAAGWLSFPFVVTFTWMGNRLFTFSQASRANSKQQLGRFMFVCAIGLIFNRGTYSLLVAHCQLVYDYPVLGLLAGTAAGMFFNFFAARRHVFR